MLGWRKRQRTDYIVVHCSETHPDQKDIEGNPIDFRYLDRKHRERGSITCGYHWIILRDGAVVSMRPQESPGNHCPGINGVSVAVCLIGGRNKAGEPDSNFTREQWDSLRQLVGALSRQYPDAEIVGHRDVADKEITCPSFDVRNWAAAIRYRNKKATDGSERDSQEANPGTPEVNR